MKKIRVLVADDHQLVRAGICSLLENAKGIEVVAEADDGYQVMELVAEHRPDVVLMDIAMPKMNGLETTSQLLAAFPEIKVIILSMYVNEEYVWQALRSKASGYMLKDAAPVELERAINSVADGSVYLSPAVSHHVVNDYVRRVNGRTDWADKLPPRQSEIWKLIAKGLSTKEIALLLHINTKTVETHRAQLMDKLGNQDAKDSQNLSPKKDNANSQEGS